MKCPLFFAITAAFVLHANTSIAAAPQRPVLRHSITNLETSWFGAPAIYDLDGDGQKELIGTYYSIYVWDTNMNLIHRMQQTARIYAPAVIADLDRDGIVEVVTGAGQRVAAYEWKNRQLSVKAGWPYDTSSATVGVEVRSLAAADGTFYAFDQATDTLLTIDPIAGTATPRHAASPIPTIASGPTSRQVSGFQSMTGESAPNR